MQKNDLFFTTIYVRQCQGLVFCIVVSLHEPRRLLSFKLPIRYRVPKCRCQSQLNLARTKIIAATTAYISRFFSLFGIIRGEHFAFLILTDGACSQLCPWALGETIDINIYLYKSERKRTEHRRWLAHFSFPFSLSPLHFFPSVPQQKGQEGGRE
jgi:hypothetical protein